MNDSLFKKNSIRNKILLPFVLIITVMTAGSVFCAVYFISNAKPFIIGSIALLVFVNALIFAIYSVIIRKITNSIEILSEVAKRVAKGDLNQQIYIESGDEIGELSYVFNQMVKNLKEYSSNLVLEKNRSEAIISSIPEGIVVTDMENRLILANKRAEEVFHFSCDQLSGKSEMNFITNEELIENKKPITRDIIFPSPEGKNRVYLLTSSLVSNAHQMSIGVITILRDITHERELEELREGFLRTVTHELRTPLTSIIGFIELICQSEEPVLSEQKRSFLKIALNEATSLKNMIDDLLDLSRMRAGKIKAILVPVNIKEMVESVVATFLPLAKGKGVSLIIDPIETGLEAKADFTKLRRVLINLVSNALKFTQEGSVTLSAHQHNKEVILSVADTGIGLIPEERDVIFEKFRQVDYSTTRKYEGIGLGLYIVKQLVDMHGGRVWVDSEYSKGSVFSFSIPV